MLTTETAVGGLGFTKYLESSVSKIGQAAMLQCCIHSDADPPQISWSVLCTYSQHYILARNQA